MVLLSGHKTESQEIVAQHNSESPTYPWTGASQERLKMLFFIFLCSALPGQWRTHVARLSFLLTHPKHSPPLLVKLHQGHARYRSLRERLPSQPTPHPSAGFCLPLCTFCWAAEQQVAGSSPAIWCASPIDMAEFGGGI